MESKITKERRNLLYSAVPTETIGTSNKISEHVTCQRLKPAEQGTGPKLGKRHIQVLTYFLFAVLECCERINMSIGIIAMTDPKSTKNPDIPVSDASETYNWTNKGIILASFFWGYSLVQPLSGWLTHRYRPKWFLFGSVGICSLVGMFIPLIAANFGSKGVIAARIVQGLSQSVMLPSINSLLAKWAPPSERTRFLAFIYSGLPIGAVVSLTLSGFMAASWYGWPMVFYSFSAVGLAWCLLFSYVGCDSPHYHSTITEDEKYFIESSLTYCGPDQAKTSIPWRKLLTSLPFWAILLSECGYSAIDYTLFTEMPSYMAHVMKFNLKSNGLLSSLPYLTKWIFTYIFSYISSILERKQFFSNTTLRKIFCTIALCVPTLAFILLGNNGPDDASKAVSLLVITITATAATIMCIIVNYLDISPNYASFLLGIVNGCGSGIGSLLPLLVHFIVTDETDPEQWKIIFYLIASISGAAWIFYIIFGSARLQPWNDNTTREGNREIQTQE